MSTFECIILELFDMLRSLPLNSSRIKNVSKAVATVFTPVKTLQAFKPSTLTTDNETSNSPNFRDNIVLFDVHFFLIFRVIPRKHYDFKEKSYVWYYSKSLHETFQDKYTVYSCCCCLVLECGQRLKGTSLH